MPRAPALPAGYRLIARGAVASTNDEARLLAAAGEPEGALVWAESQSAGRGRRGRHWISPPGNLYLSLLLRPACPAPEGAQFSFVAGLALCEALEEAVPGLALACKWPNDVLAEGRKLAGILLESAGDGRGGLEWLIVGVGVNVASHPALNDEAAQPATSLRALGAAPPLPRLLEGFAQAFARRGAAWRAQGFGPIRLAWLARAAGLGEPVEVWLESERVAGMFGDLTESGELVITLPTGARRHLAGGEVRLLRRP